MNCLYDEYVNNISEWNLLYGILNTSKHTKNINIHYSPILHGYMDILGGKAKFKNFLILLDSGCISMTVMRRLIKIETK